MPGTSRFPALDWRFSADHHLHMAEAFGHAWVQQKTGGSVTLVRPVNRHPWWSVLRAWLPSDAPLRIESTSGGTIDTFPERPFAPVDLASLTRSGIPDWDSALGIERTLLSLCEREPLLYVDIARPHPAIAVALAAIGGWGWQVVWCLRGPLTWSDWDETLRHIGARQLPLTLIVDTAPPTPIAGWWIHRPAGIGATAAALQWQLMHDWPGVIVPGPGPDTIPTGWLPSP